MILLVQSYPGANDAVKRHYPLWNAQGFERIIGVGTDGGGCTWPGGMESCLIGKDSYIDRDVLPRRLIDTMSFALSLGGWQEAAIIEYDTLLFKQFPSPLPIGLSAHLAGGRHHDLKGTAFYHNPWVAPRQVWQQIRNAGQSMIDRGDIEDGSPDTFLGWLVESYGIPVFSNTWFGYSRNTIHTPEWIAEAREARLRGATAIHGVKTKEVLDGILKAERTEI